MPTYFITAATGHQGGAVAHQLLSLGHSVRAIVRNAESEASRALAARGATLYQGNYYEEGLLSTALAGAVGVFLNPHIDREDANGQAGWARIVLAAAVAAGSVRHVVASSAFQTGRLDEFARRDPNFPVRQYYEVKADVERAVRETANAAAEGEEEEGRGGKYTWTILRPAWIMFNYLPPQVSMHFPELYTPARELAVLYRPGVRMPHIAEEDVGKFAVAAFLDPARFAGATIDLGNENLTIDEAAEELSKAAGLKVTVRRRDDLEKEKMASVLATQVFHELANWTDVTIPEGSLDKWGISLTTFAEYLEENREKLKAAFSESKGAESGDPK